MDEREDQLGSYYHPLLSTTTTVQAGINESLEYVVAMWLEGMDCIISCPSWISL